MIESPKGGTDAAQPAPRLTIGLHCTRERDLAEFARVLGWFGDVRLIMDSDCLNERLDVDLIVTELGGVDLLEVSRLRKCRAENPDVPLLMLGRGVSGNIGVELVRLLGDDILLLPVPDENALFRKVERLLIGGWMPAFEDSYLAVLKASKLPSGEERRRVIRADVPDAWRMWAIVEDLEDRLGDVGHALGDAEVVTQVHEQEVPVVALAMHPPRQSGLDAGVLKTQLPAGVRPVAMHRPCPRRSTSETPQFRAGPTGRQNAWNTRPCQGGSALCLSADLRV